MSAMEKLKKFMVTDPPIVIALVVEIDIDERTCKVEPLNGDPAIFDVKLQSSTSGTKGLLTLPVINSVVHVAMLDNNTGFVVGTDMISLMEISLENTQFCIQNEGLKLSRQDDDLRKTMIKFCDELSTLVDNVLSSNYNTSQGPTTGIVLTSVTALNARKTQLQAIKNSFQNLLA